MLSELTPAQINAVLFSEVVGRRLLGGENLTNWRSVVAWGVYRELQGKEALDALQLLVARLMPLVTSEPPTGQQQRVLLARALATDPDLLVLDEPTVGMERRQ